MRNIDVLQQIKGAIFLKWEEFANIIEKLFGNKVYVTYYNNIMNVCRETDSENLFEEDFVSPTELSKVLSEYFDVNVISVHSNQSNIDMGVWIIYEDIANN